MTHTTIWTSVLVEQTIEKLRYGMDVDMSCFHEKDTELKAAKILFKHTQDELEEFVKCANDINYFVEKYCRFLTDYGRITVKLREFQREILEELAKEKWSNKLLDKDGDPMQVPVNRNYILMAARQIGKCLFNSKIEIKDKNSSKVLKMPLNILYYIHKEHLTFLEKLKFKLMLLYNKVDKW